MNLFFSSDRGFDSSGPSRSVVTSPSPLLPSPPHSFLCCWQSYMVTSHLPYGPLPLTLPGPEGAVQGLRLCRVQDMGRSQDSPHSFLGSAGVCSFQLQNVSSAMPLSSIAKGRLSWHSKVARGNQTGHQGHEANSLPVASPSSLGDQIYLMVKGLAGPAARVLECWAQPVLLCFSQDWG